MGKRKGIDNLIPLNERTQRERKEIAAMGAKATNEANRKRKTLKESMNTLLSLDIKNTKDWNKVAAMGIDPGEIDNSQLVILALFDRAKKGDVFAIKELRDLIGEEHESNSEQEQEHDNLISAIKKAVDDED